MVGAEDSHVSMETGSLDSGEWKPGGITRRECQLAEVSHGAPVLGGDQARAGEEEGAVPEPEKTDLSLPLVLSQVTTMRINVE